MHEIQTSVDTVDYSMKPGKWETAAISKRIGSSKKHIDVTNIKSFTEDVGQNGIAFAPATFKGGTRKAETFGQMQLLTLDFDNDATLLV